MDMDTVKEFVGDIGNEADSNMSIADQLNAEVDKFKFE